MFSQTEFFMGIYVFSSMCGILYSYIILQKLQYFENFRLFCNGTFSPYCLDIIFCNAWQNECCLHVMCYVGTSQITDSYVKRLRASEL
jgi:hypothetical protein